MSSNQGKRIPGSFEVIFDIFYISQFDLLDVVLAFLISILKIFKSLQNFWHRVTDITSFGKRLVSSLGHTLNFCPYLVKYRFRIMFHKESLTLSSMVILSTNFWGSKAKRIYLVGLENSETPSTSSVWPNDDREDYRSCARPFYSLVQIIHKALHSD